MIALTGATGVVGGRVAALLAEAGVPRRLVVRDPSRAPQGDVRQVAGYDAFDDMRAALEGATTLLFVPGHNAEARVAQHETVVDAAVAAGVRRVVYLSFVGAGPDATFERAVEHGATEEHIRTTGVAWTFLRMNLYLDFVQTMVNPDGVIRGPAGDGRLAAVHRDDVAAAAAAILRSPDRHDGEAYDLTGREAFTLAEAAATFARLTGKAVRFEDETDEQAFESRRRAYSAPDWMIRGWISSYRAIRDGDLAAVTSAVRDLTAREPITLEEHVRAHPDALAHVTGEAL
jgi:uncharacterized protein YbjT (DUF2867 family)